MLNSQFPILIRALFLESVLSAEFDQAPAHDLYRVPPLVILQTIPRLLVEDGAVVENVIDVEIRLHLARIAQPEEPAETEIELFDPLPVERVVGNQVDRGSLRTGRRGLTGARREMPTQGLPDVSISDHIARPYWETRLILVDAADLHAPRERVDGIETERCPAGPRLANVAETRPRIHRRYCQGRPRRQA